MRTYSISFFSTVLFTFFFSTNAIAVQNQTSEIQAAYNSITSIENEEDRIVAELELSLLGLSDQASNRRDIALNKIRATAEAVPEKRYLYDFVLSRGYSIDELSQVIESGNFETVSGIQAKFVSKGFVQTVGFVEFERYAGTPEKVLLYLVEEQATKLDFQIKTMNAARVPVSKKLLLAKNYLSDADQIRFYKLSGRMKSKNASLLLSQIEPSIIHVQQREVRGLPYVNSDSQKQPVPDARPM